MAKRSKSRAKLGTNFRPPAATEGTIDESTQAQGEQNSESAAAQGAGDPDGTTADQPVQQPEHTDAGVGATELGSAGADQPALVTAGAVEDMMTFGTGVEIVQDGVAKHIPLEGFFNVDTEEQVLQQAENGTGAVAGADDGSYGDMERERSAYGDYNTLAAWSNAQVATNVGVGGYFPWSGMETVGAKSQAAAAFIRANPDAPADALPIELKLRGFRDLPDTTPRVLLAWRVFAFTLKELDALDRAERERADATALATAERAAPVWPGDRALKVADQPFAPTGLSVR